jgi:ATP-dependent Clp protease ATP-binding subunit ClpC
MGRTTCSSDSLIEPAECSSWPRRNRGNLVIHSLELRNILLGLIREHDGIAARALDSLVVNYEPVRARVVEIVGPSNGSSPSPPPFTERAKKVLELSLRTALQLGHSYIGTEHLLLGLVLEGNGVAVHVLVDLGIDMTSV